MKISWFASFASSLVFINAVSAQEPAPAQPEAVLSLEERLRLLEEKVRTGDHELRALREQVAAKAPSDSKPKWFDKLSLRGYGQVRYTTLFNENNTPNLNVPNDRSVTEPESLTLRRGRVTLSGDITSNLYMYAQVDFAGTNGAPDQALQMRDYYADIAVDSDKESRFRVGTSKVPYGWVNLQSSQNRAAIERPDALNSGVEGERDLGAFYYWAPKHIRALYSELVKSGRKGSGDYGVLGVGAYAGQGPNRSDLNGDVHWAARLAYPFELENKQVVELGVYGYTGDFVVSTGPIGGITPTADATGIDDERIGATFVWYPQPFGIEAEWTWGRGPQLSDDGTRIVAEYLQGGYVQASWLSKEGTSSTLPFLRWNMFDGARKFARNAPRHEVSELDLGVEWAPVPEVELTAMYTHTFWRTDTSTAPFGDARGDDRLTLQVQVNF